jgi:lysophospholipase L1-like esterase
VSNQGAGGETSGQILTRFEAYPSGYDDPVILAMGRNDYTPTATPNIATAVSHLTTTHYLIHSILPAAFDPPATVSGIASVNANLASVYGTRFVDCLAALQAANDGSPGDLADIAAGYSPRSLRFDGLHLNSAGYTVVANALYAKRALLGF